jgi:WD40 repeat protein
MPTVMSPPEPVQFGEPQWHADGVLLALAFAADGSLWSVEEPGLLKRWDGRGRPVEQVQLGDLEVLWAFGPRAELLVSASDDLEVWDVKRRQPIAAVAQTSWVTAVAFHPTRQVIASGHDDGSIRLWDLARGKPIDLTFHKHAISALAFNSDGSLLASAAEDRKIAIWDALAPTLRRTLTGHTDRIPALAWQRDTNLLLSAGWDTTVRLWELAGGEPSMLLNTHSDQVHTLAFSPDGSLLAVADSSGAVHIWSDVVEGKESHVLPGDLEEVHTLAFSPDGKRLAVGGNDRVVHIWDPYTGKPLAGRAAHDGHAIAVSPGPMTLLVSNAGGTALRVWDTNSRAEAEPAGLVAAPLALAASDNGRWIAITNAEPDSRLYFWDRQTRYLRPPVEGPRAPMTFAAFSPDSRRLATCCRTDGTAWLWNPEDGEPVLIIPEAAEGCTVEALVFHPNGCWLACGGVDYLATGGSDGAVAIWDVDSRDKVTTFDGGALGLTFDPSGERLAVVSPDGAVRLWDVKRQEVIGELRLPDASAVSAAFSTDARDGRLVVAFDDHTLRLIDPRDGRQSLIELDSGTRFVRFSADGRTVYTGNGNTTCYLVSVAALLDG